MATPRVSVIINTLDRADSLSLLLESLQMQWFDEPFEVVVVTGPCSDHTPQVIQRWEGSIKHLQCDVANLSRSRNIGIAAAAGDIVVFIDDDAIPEPRWLAELIAPFAQNETVIATGGFVRDHTGFGLQCRFNSCDRLGRAAFHSAHPLNDQCVPGAMEFPYVPGGNAAWLRDRLIAIGAFDENYEYYLDEVDVAVRAIDAGWTLAQVAGAEIHHKFLPSSVRSSGKVLVHRYPVLKNKLLFGLLNGRRHHSIEEILAEGANFTLQHRSDVQRHLDAGSLGSEMLDRFDIDAETALTDALDVGLRQARRLGGDHLRSSNPGPLEPFPVRVPVGPRRRYVFVSQTIPPDPIGGIGRYMLDLGRGLAEQGHEIRVITDGVDHDTIDFEDRVWVHRLVKPDLVEDPAPGDLPGVPPRIWANAVRVETEVARLCEDHPVDVVYAAVWDTEALAVQQRRTAPVAVALVTSLALALESKPSWADDDAFRVEFAAPMIEVERRFIADADAVHAISETILAEIQRSNAVRIDPEHVRVAQLGCADPREAVLEESGPRGTMGTGPTRGDPSSVRLLFVGRFEKRKGVDLLLGALSEVMTDVPTMISTLIGKVDLPGPDGKTWREWMDAVLPAGEWRDRLHLLGEVPDEVLHEEYSRSDLFVAPSRFESFGLIYVEAMAHGLPVVAVDRGAAPEVIADGCGLLVEPSREALVKAITTLVGDPAMRRAMGEAGRRRFEAQFTIDAMVDRVGDVLSQVGTTVGRNPSRET